MAERLTSAPTPDRTSAASEGWWRRRESNLAEVQKTAHFLKSLDKLTLSNRQNRSKSRIDPQIAPSKNLEWKPHLILITNVPA
jgi:ferric-dicitrate binding protein FerR (iron transport regulator)